MPSIKQKEKKSVKIDQNTPLTRSERQEALAQVRELLGQVRTDWEYVPPRPKPAPEPLRQGSLGAWLPGSPGAIITAAGAAFVNEECDNDDDEEDRDDDEEEEGDDDDEHAGFSDDDGTPMSYRRPRTPPPPPLLYKRKKAKPSLTTPATSWRARQCDSDFEPPSPATLAASDESPYIFASPDDVLPALHRRRLQYYTSPSSSSSSSSPPSSSPPPLDNNPGQTLFHLRRDAWTNSSPATGLIPVCTSRFADNPLTRLVVPEVYPQIYKKVVVDGAVPPVPIALDKMMAAIVEGWKREGAWGRKTPAPEPSMRARTGTSTRKEREREKEKERGRL